MDTGKQRRMRCLLKLLKGSLMGQHAILSASASKRWMNCTPSALLERQFADEESIYVAEGTAAHALAEHKLKRFLKKRSKRPVIEKAKQSCSDPIVMIEQRLDFSRWVPEGFGTGDLVIVADDTLYIVDLKYGKGIAVSAEWNPQMLLYSLGALELFDSLYDIEKVNMTIHQPRLENVSTFEITVHDLMEWAEQELMPKAEMAAKGEGEFAVGDWCRFCKAKNTCRARAEEYLRLAQMEFKPPEVLKVADELAKWSADVYAYAQDEAITHGRVWNGFKLVEGRSNRRKRYPAETA